MATHDDFPTWSVGLARLAVRLVVVVAIALALHHGLERLTAYASATGDTKLMIGALTLLLLSYALLIAVPFMPGIEIGVGLLILQGASIAPFVYAATVFGLLLAFFAGRYTPYAWLHALLRDLRWRSACNLVERLEPMDQQARMTHLASRLPERARSWIKAGRYVLFGGLLNLPGNAVIGGGGGIAFIAGFSRLFSPSLTTLTIMLAVLPIPLAVWLSGVDILL